MKTTVKIDTDWLSYIFALTDDIRLYEQYFTELSNLLLGHQLSDGLSSIVTAALLPVSIDIAQQCAVARSLSEKRSRAARRRWDGNRQFEQPNHLHNVQENFCSAKGFVNADVSNEIVGFVDCEFPEKAPEVEKNLPKNKDSAEIFDDTKYNAIDADDTQKFGKMLNRMQMSDMWVSSVAKTHGLTKIDVKTWLLAFSNHCISHAKTHHRCIADAKRHFNSWLKIRLACRAPRL